MSKKRSSGKGRIIQTGRMPNELPKNLGPKVAQVPIIGGADAAKITQADLEHAAEDARFLMANSPIIPKLIAVDIISRRIFLLVRGALEEEILRGWEVDNPQLVMQTLGMSAQEKANDWFTARELQQQVMETIIPVVDIFVKMEVDTLRDLAHKKKDEGLVDRFLHGDPDARKLYHDHLETRRRTPKEKLAKASKKEAAAEKEPDDKAS